MLGFEGLGAAALGCATPEINNAGLDGTWNHVRRVVDGDIYVHLRVLLDQHLLLAFFSVLQVETTDTIYIERDM